VLVFLSLFFVSCAGTGGKSSDLREDEVKEKDLLKEKTGKTSAAKTSTSNMMENPPSFMDLATEKSKPPTPDELEVILAEEGEKWFYGPGLGRTMLNVGTIVAFPPYAIYLVGNAGLKYAGYDPLYVTDLLPEEPREGVLEVYDGVTSVPGRLTSAASGRDFPGTEPK